MKANTKENYVMHINALRSANREFVSAMSRVPVPDQYEYFRAEIAGYVETISARHGLDADDNRAFRLSCAKVSGVDEISDEHDNSEIIYVHRDDPEAEPEELCMSF